MSNANNNHASPEIAIVMKQLAQLEADLSELHRKWPSELFRAGLECAQRNLLATKAKIKNELAQHRRACQFPIYPN